MTKRDLEAQLRERVKEMTGAKPGVTEQETSDLSFLQKEVETVREMIDKLGLPLSDRLILDSLRTYFVGSKFANRLEVSWTYNPVHPGPYTVDFSPFLAIIEPLHRDGAQPGYKILVGRPGIAEEAAKNRFGKR
jgi:hypothetical protein